MKYHFLKCVTCENWERKKINSRYGACSILQKKTSKANCCGSFVLTNRLSSDTIAWGGKSIGEIVVKELKNWNKV